MLALVLCLALTVTLAGAFPALSQAQSQAEEVGAAAAVAESITYQGRLTDTSGNPLNGNHTMRFRLHSLASGGTLLFDGGNQTVNVVNGLFTVALPVPHTRFNGQELWLAIEVAGQLLSPRQQVTPAPYAMSLRPGASIVGDAIGAAGATLAGYAPATGTAVHAEAYNGIGLFGLSENNYGVRGASFNSWGGYFSSSGGYGIRVATSGTDHYDHGAYVTSASGYGVYAQSGLNQGVRGEAGNVSGIAQPIGAVGVVGIGSNRGTYGSSAAGVGVYGVSDSNYGVWGQSNTWRGVTGRTSRADNNYGFYTPDNLYALNYTVAGATMQVMQNGGSEPVAPGDVVVFSGINREVTAVDGPIVQVTRTDVANSTAVAGVVFSRFNVEAIDPELEFPAETVQERTADMAITPPGDAAPGEYILVVVQGPALVKASAVGGSIQTGDLLSTGGSVGLAGKAATINVSTVEATVPGTVFGKALETLDRAQDQIYVYVTLN